jgi:hypothetical protein
VLGGYFQPLGHPMIDLGMPSDTTLNISGPNGRLVGRLRRRLRT